MKIFSHKKSLFVFSFAVIILAFIYFVAHPLFCSSVKDQAANILEQLLSCTQEQADLIDRALSPEVSIESEPGISPQQNSIEVFFQENYGVFMTESCIEKLLQNRTFYKSVSLCKQHNCSIKVSELSLEERKSSANIYDFHAVLKSFDGDELASVFGSISMKEIDSTWKASDITLTVQ